MSRAFTIATADSTFVPSVVEIDTTEKPPGFRRARRSLARVARHSRHPDFAEP
jgi:hypothetical protein